MPADLDPDRAGPDASVTAERIARTVLARTGNGPVTEAWRDNDRGYDGLILARLRAGRAAGTIGSCPHAGGPLLCWFPAPGCPVGCPVCVMAWIWRNVAGTAEDGVCDICRRPAAGQEKQERSMVLRTDIDQALTVTFFVCPACEAAEPA
jgi:hypothetical protein